MRIDSSGKVGIGNTAPNATLHVQGSGTTDGSIVFNQQLTATTAYNSSPQSGSMVSLKYNTGGDFAGMGGWSIIKENGTDGNFAGAMLFHTRANGGSITERARITSGGLLLVGTTNATGFGGHAFIASQTVGSLTSIGLAISDNVNGTMRFANQSGVNVINFDASNLAFQSGGTTPTERARITSDGNLLVGKTAANTVNAGAEMRADGLGAFTRASDPPLIVNRLTNDGTLVSLQQASVEEGTISVSGATVSYNGFSGGHWTQLPEGRGHNPDILRGTVMSTIGEMCEWKSVVWDEVIEHPAVPAVEAKEEVLDEEGNVIEPAVEAVEGKDAWTETINKRDSYLGQLPIGATFEEDGFTKTVVDDGNERLPKVKISDVVGDKAVYGVFQTWDEVQDMLVTSLGAFVVRIASGVTVQIGDLLESNGDGCAKVQDDDVIRSKTIAKVTSTTPTATYADGSYTVPAVIYCG